MRQPTAALAAAVLCVSVVGCASSVGNAQSPTPTRTMIPRPLVERELTGLLLTPDQVNAAMGTTGMAVTSQQDAMSDNSATMAPPECLAIDGAAEAPVYADSGFWAERDQSLKTATSSRTISSRRWCCSPRSKRPASSSTHQRSGGRPAASTRIRRARRSGPSGRSPTRAAH